MLNLETLAAELHRVATAKDSPSTLDTVAMSGCAKLRALPRYAGEAGLERLLSDLEHAIDDVLSDDDRRIARAHFRLDYGDRQYLARHRALTSDHSNDTTKTRRRAKQLEGNLAFHLFQCGIEWEEPYETLDAGFRAIEKDWTLTVDPLDIRIETLTQLVDARAARPGQRFYVFACDNEGGKTESIKVVSDDPDHVLVGEDGIVPVEHNVPNGEFFIVLYLGKDYATNQKVKTGIESVAKLSARPADSGVFFGPTTHPVDNLRMTAHVPLALAPVMTLIDRKPPAWGAERSTTVVRTDESPVVYKVKPKLGHKYEILWVYSS